MLSERAEKKCNSIQSDPGLQQMHSRHIQWTSRRRTVQRRPWLYDHSPCAIINFFKSTLSHQQERLARHPPPPATANSPWTCVCVWACAACRVHLNCICAQFSCFSAFASMTLVMRLQTFYAPLLQTVDANANTPFSVHFVRADIYFSKYFIQSGEWERERERQDETEKGNFCAIISISNPLAKIFAFNFHSPKNALESASRVLCAKCETVQNIIRQRLHREWPWRAPTDSPCQR